MNQDSKEKLFNRQLSPVTIALLYAGFAAVWIIASGMLLNITVADPVLHSQLELGKGLLFVVVTGSLLYLLVRWNQIKLRRLTRLYAALSQCNQAIVRCTNMEELFPQICRDAVNFGGMKMAWIGMVDPSTGLVKPVASFGEGLDYLDNIHISLDANEPTGRGSTGTAIRDNIAIWSQDYHKDPSTVAWRERAAHFGWHASAALPLHLNGVVIGALTIYAGEVFAFDEGERNLLLEMALDISFALDNFDRDAARIKAEQALRESETFNITVLSSLIEHIAVLNRQGVIVTVNRAWQQFAKENGAPELATGSVGLNYLDICDTARSHLHGDEAEAARAGILAVLSGALPSFELEYSCHSQNTQRWFVMYVSPLSDAGGGVVIAHENITVRKQLQQLREESRGRIQKIASQLPGVIYQFKIRPDGSSCMPFASAALSQIFRVNPDEVVEDASKIFSALHPDDHDAVVAALQQSAQNLSPWRQEFRVQFGNEAARWIYANALPQRESDGSVMWHGFVSDITERKQVETALIESEALYSNLFANNSVAMLLIDPSDGQIVDANARASDYYGWAEKILRSMNISAINTHEPEQVQTRLNLTKQGKANHFEFRHRLANGNLRDVEVFSGPITIGNRLLVQSAIIDISDRKLAEQQARSAQALTQHFLDHLPGMAYIKDSNLRILMANQGFKTLLGVDPAGLIGKTNFNVFPRAFANKVNVDDERVLASGISESVIDEYKGRHYTTTKFVIDGEDGGKLLGGITLDISDRKALEANLIQQLDEVKALNTKLEDAQNQLVQSEKMAAIGQLTAGIAHEINNPISFIQSNVTTLSCYVDELLAVDSAYREAKTQLAAQLPHVFERVHQIKQVSGHDYIIDDLPKLIRESLEGLERVVKIVLALRNFSRVGEVDWQWVDIHHGLDSTLNIVRNVIKNKAEITCQYGKLPLVHCIPAQLNQVFLNLLVNAAQSIEGVGHIIIRTGHEENNIWIEVQDDGSGIPPEIMKHVFEPFFTTKPVGKGTGLGLSLSWGIVQRHKGRIDVHSEPGVKTTFRVVLPVDPLLELA